MMAWLKRLFAPPPYVVVLWRRPISQEWVVELHKMGAVFEVATTAPRNRHRGEGVARSLAGFMGCELRIVEPEGGAAQKGEVPS